jgi:multiphosphoryl transfer protein
MVGIVIVSHSARLAEGVVELAREMGGPDVSIEAAGGTDDPDAPLGTDATKVMAAIESADSGDGVLVLMDLGSAVMSAEMALDLLGPDPDRRVELSDAPLIEGAVSAATTAKLGATLEEVASEARGALAPKSSHLGTTEGAGQEAAAEAPVQDDASAELDVVNKLGLHARPAARFVQTAASFDADVRVTNLDTGIGPVSARSLNAVATLGARRGHHLRVAASGTDAERAIEALSKLADAGFGDRDDSGAVEAPPPRTVDREGWVPGVAASPGIAIGPARSLRAADVEIGDESPADATEEWSRLTKAMEESRADIQAMRHAAAREIGESEAQIFDAHLLLLQDEELLEPARAAILKEGRAAARAWRDAIDAIAGRFEALEDAYQAERASDVRDVGNRVLAHLLGVSAGRSVSGPGILIVPELAPADAAALDPKVTTGIVSARGGATSHGAILARSLGIPAVVGAGDSATDIGDGSMVVVDGDAGAVLVSPGERELSEWSNRREAKLKIAREQLEAANAPAHTADGTRIEVYANAGSPEDADRALEVGAEGIGLLRTEFLFVDRAQPPSEEEQYAVLCDIAKRMSGRPVIVRTLDAGADKPIPYVSQAHEDNPFLGVRGVRLSLEHRDLFVTQLRAIVRAASEYPLKVMFPMITTVAELNAALDALDEARAGLRHEAMNVGEDIDTGIMVEVPGAALTAEVFARRAAFMSIGTNDLTQYTLAAERGNERVAALADPLHPGVLRLIDTVVRAAQRSARWVGVCGEAAGDVDAAVMFVGLGVTELSMAPAAIPAVKHALRSIELDAASRLAEAALAAESAQAVRRLIAGAR